MTTVLEEIDSKMQDAMMLRFRLAHVHGESAAQAYGDMIAILTSIPAAAVTNCSNEEKLEMFVNLREIANDVIGYLEKETLGENV